MHFFSQMLYGLIQIALNLVPMGPMWQQARIKLGNGLIPCWKCDQPLPEPMGSQFTGESSEINFLLPLNIDSPLKYISIASMS